MVFYRDMFIVFWLVIDIFDDVNDKFNVFYLIFDDIFDLYAFIKEVKIRSRLNFCIIEEIRVLMKMRDYWRKLVRKINDR